MKYISIGVANNLYICLKHSVILRHKVYHEVFHDFCTSIAKLEHALGELSEDDFWQELLHEVKYYRFILYAAPLPLNTFCEKLLPFIQVKLKNCYFSFPNFVAPVQNLADKLSILIEVCENPLLEAIAKLLPDQEQQTAALLLKETYLFPLVEDVLLLHPSFQHIQVVNHHQLRGTDCYHRLFVIGPSHWHPEYILRSPHAKEIHLIRYSWLRDALPSSSVFLKPFKQQQSTGNNIEVTRSLDIQGDDEQDNTSDYADQNIQPQINWQNISSRILRQTQDDPGQEHVQAKLYLLANEQAVFLEANDNTKVHVLDLVLDEDDEDEEGTQQVKPLTLDKVLPGMFLLLRTEGGGDYILPIANGILRERASLLRAKQEHWKALLRKAVEAKGITETSIELLYLDSEIATEINVRNWMSNRNIRPQKDADFHAILQLVGLQDREQEYKDAAGEIDSAHRKAGVYIRKQLLKQVANVDLQELHRKGYMDFELSEADGGSLTAFRVEHIAPGSFDIPASRIGHPTKVKGLLWQG